MKNNIKILSVLLLAFGLFTVTGCNNNKTETKSNETETKVEEKATDYSGTFKSNDSSYITITKDGSDYKANISIYKLASFSDCTVDDIKDDVLYISGVDPNEKPIEFTFDYKTKVLTVKDTTWKLLKEGTTFDLK